MKILVAVDNSEWAKKALDQAIRTAKTENAELLILTVIPLVGAVDGLSAAYVEKLKKAGEALLAEASLKAEAESVTVTQILEEGPSPADNIITCAEDYQVGLIIMGHRSSAKITRFLLGSVAFRVISNAPCSVMVIK